MATIGPMTGAFATSENERVWDAYYEATRTLTDAAKAAGRDLRLEVRD
jgi:hypothetical protein